ncbi:secretion-regulating guanine nucleotide exchange factor [Genypterus blacodes]|uniref:secretion-regulating guanine nucleotide exchange factor n=1 Tax=Genypterus blacodes TaxID=154954 RepID=UPI003F7574B8
MEFCLHAWGANSYGQLGQGHVEDRAAPQSSDTAALHSRTARAVIGGGGHTVLLTENGEVLVCGNNHRGQLGLGHTANVLTFHLCSSLSQRVKSVACGWDFTLLLSVCGEVLACGSNSFGQLGVGETPSHSANLLRVKGLKEPVLSVAAGLRHSLAVTGSARVYQWGTGLFRQAKRALSPQSVPPHLNSKVPTQVPGLDHETPHTVTAGSAHCVCLTVEGDLFAWGSNKFGQLTPGEPFQCCPTRLDRSLLDGDKVMLVWSGWTHVVAQTEGGRVFTWGRDDYGQLGQTAATDHTGQKPERRSAGASVSRPAEVKLLCGATQIACGSEHNLAIVGGRLLSWGWNEHGMCGDGTEVDVPQPRLVPSLRPLLVGCGAGHSVAVCATKTKEEEEESDLRL